MTRLKWLPLSSSILSLCSGLALLVVPGLPIMPIAVLVLLSGSLAIAACVPVRRTSAGPHTPAPHVKPTTRPVPTMAATALSTRKLERLRELSHQAAEGYADSLALMPFAKAILAAVPTKTEQATMVLIDQCMDIKNKTHRESELARQAANCLIEGCTDTSLAEAIQQTRAAINEERHNIAADSRSGTEQIQAMDQEIDAGVELLRDIDEITQRSKIIAISLSIEASRIGEIGHGFQVISREMHALIERSIDYSDKVGKLFTRLKSCNAALMTAMADQTRQIDADLQRLLESLQFQDISRQMIEGASAILDDLQTNLAKVQPLLESFNQNILSDYRTRQDRLRQVLVDRSKTVDEKHAIRGVKQ